MRNQANRRRDGWMPLLYGLLLIALHCALMALLHAVYAYQINSDASSEMVLARQLVQERAILSKSWFYSTELRVLNTQLVYAFFFQFSDNWQVVRLLSTCVMHLMLSGSAICLCRALGCKRSAPLTAFAVLLPLCYEYFDILLSCCYYVPHAVISFLAVAMVCAQRKRSAVRLILFILLAFAAGLGGLRQIVVTYLPLLMAAGLMSLLALPRMRWAGYRKSEAFSFTGISLAGLVACGAGYWVNSAVLAETYRFSTWQQVHLTGLDMARVGQAAKDILVTLGFTGAFNTPQRILSNVLCIVLTALTLYSLVLGFRRDAAPRYRLLSLFYLCNLLVFLGIYGLTDMTYASRYNIPVVIFTFPLIMAGLLKGPAKRPSKAWRRTILLGVVALAAAQGIVNGAYILRIQNNEQQIEIARAVREAGYRTGYATYWNANLITELTNGEVDMYAWDPLDENSPDLEYADQLMPWLQTMRHWGKRPTGKVFLLLSDYERARCRWGDRLADERVIYRADPYTVYGYDDVWQVLALSADYAYAPGEDRWLTNGEARDGARVLHPGGVSRGPGMTFCEGVYRVEVTGENLSRLSAQAYTSALDRFFDLSDKEQTEDRLAFSFFCDTDCRHCEIILTNTGEGDAVLRSIQIRWAEE